MIWWSLHVVALGAFLALMRSDHAPQPPTDDERLEAAVARLRRKADAHSPPR
ncbi:MAG TPA: hypothetical protein V6D47_06550 [Oscillatoriaceae cyanobacterium]